jgi:hypothetical protein
MAYPAPFLEPIGESLGEQLARQAPGVGQQFDVSTIAPKVAQVNPLYNKLNKELQPKQDLVHYNFLKILEL